jgi:hypothetical protein
MDGARFCAWVVDEQSKCSQNLLADRRGRRVAAHWDAVSNFLQIAPLAASIYRPEGTRLIPLELNCNCVT